MKAINDIDSVTTKLVNHKCMMNLKNSKLSFKIGN